MWFMTSVDLSFSSKTKMAKLCVMCGSLCSYFLLFLTITAVSSINGTFFWFSMWQRKFFPVYFISFFEKLQRKLHLDLKFATSFYLLYLNIRIHFLSRYFDYFQLTFGFYVEKSNNSSWQIVAKFISKSKTVSLFLCVYKSRKVLWQKTTARWCGVCCRFYDELEIF